MAAEAGNWFVLVLASLLKTLPAVAVKERNHLQLNEDEWHSADQSSSVSELTAAQLPMVKRL